MRVGENEIIIKMIHNSFFIVLAVNVQSYIQSDPKWKVIKVFLLASVFVTNFLFEF